jgi:putative ABC transport system permease protein
MKFILGMAWRDSRASRRRLLLFSLCVVFGIAAVVALGSFGDSLGRAIQDQTKALLGADLVIGSRAELSVGAADYVRGLGGRQAVQTTFSSMMVFPGSGGNTRLVQVRAVAGDFPFYGDFVTEPSPAVGELRAAEATGRRVVILEDSLFNQFQVRVGDTVKLGRAEFTVIGALKKIAGESLAVTLFAPRVYLPQSALAAAGLDATGPLARHQVALALPPAEDPDAIVGAMREQFGPERLSFDTVASRRRDLGRALTNVDGFLSLVGFIALLLGAIGVASAVHVYVRQKIPTVAILRCLGASAGQSVAIYLIQGVALGAFGALIGGALGAALQLALPPLFQNLLPVPVAFHLSAGALGRGMASGFVICVLFTLLPLLAIRRTSPLQALRAGGAEAGSPRDGAVWVVGAGIVAAVAGFAIWQTRSLPVGLGFTGGLGLGLGILAGLARLTAAAARRWAPRRLPYVARQGIANLHRPNNRTVLLLMALGLGTFLLLTLVLTRAAFDQELRDAGAGERPNLIFFDVQDDQILALDQLLAAHGAPVRQQAPIVTMKITRLKGRTIEDWLARPDGRIPGWTLRREYRSTFRSSLSETETLVSGRWIGQVPPATALIPVSVDQGLAEDMRLKLGDEIEWDVQGIPLRSQVASIRSINWRRMEPNFFVVFPLGVLEAAPKFYVAAVRTASPAAAGEIQRAVVAQFPNVSSVDLALVLQTLDGIFSKVSFAIGFMALFTVATGLVVLAGAVWTGRYQRRQESVLLRTLGASRRQLAQIQAVEFAILGLLAAAVGAGLAVAGSAALAHWVFDLRPAIPPLALAGALAAVTTLTLVTGWLSDRGLSSRPPLEILRVDG